MRLYRTAPLIILLFLILPLAIAKTTPIDAIQTIPPIITSSATAIAGCTVLDLFPGSVVSGQSGFIQATCPNSQPAMLFGTVPETPTFLLATGFQRIGIMYQNTACSFNYLPVFHIPGTNRTYTTRLLGMNITSGGPVPFTSSSNSTTQLLSGGYNYCLYYSMPAPSGIATFTIQWIP